MLKVHLMGGEGVGWALDESLALTRRTLAALDGIIETPLADADVVYSEEPLHLTLLRPGQLEGKRVIAQLDNDLFWLWGQPYMVKARELVHIWVAQNRADYLRLKAEGLECRHIPLAVDTEIFKPEPPASKEELRKKWGVPHDRFIIGNFMRDSLAGNLETPKPQKAPELFLAIVRALYRKGCPIHVLLAGPRRHWLRKQLQNEGIPYTFAGTVSDRDDIKVNVLDKPSLNELYHLIDLYLVTSRWEAGSRVVLEACATKCGIASTRVGLSPDVLEPGSLFSSYEEGLALVERQVVSPPAARVFEARYEKVIAASSVSANAPRYHELFKAAAAIVPAGRKPLAKKAGAPGAGEGENCVCVVFSRLRNKLRSFRPGSGIRVSLWHEFHKPPYGGGNQFMLALKGGLEKLGCRVVANRLNTDVDCHICNSAWFDVPRFTEFTEKNALAMIHRIDGPISLYRGTDRAMDDRIFELNRRFASATVLQSAWTSQRLREMGFDPVRPMIIHNAVDPKYFHRKSVSRRASGGKTRLISTSWSDNPRKGGSIYKWLDDNLDWDRFEYTFVGRVAESFKRIRQIPPVHSRELGTLLREHDIYVAASLNDPCSNALVEALSCGLPALYLESGGHPELAGFGGLGFKEKEEIPALLERLTVQLDIFRGLIYVEDIDSVARKYLALMEMLC